MDTTPLLESQPGVVENPGGGYHIHVRLNERGMAAGSLLDPRATMPPDIPVLAELSVFEDCVLFTLQDGDAVVVHVSSGRSTTSAKADTMATTSGCPGAWQILPTSSKPSVIL